jgi:arsenite methyltransferase
VLRPGGRLSVFEPINSYAYPGPAEQWGPWDVEPVLDLAERVKDVFRAIHADAAASMHDFVAEDVLAWAEGAGFREIVLDVTYAIVPPRPRPWAEVENVAANPLVPTLGEAIDRALDADEAARFRVHLRAQVEAGAGLGRSAHAYLRAVR